MYLSLRGGQYDVFKYRIYTNWIPHNFAFDARTPYDGAGSQPAGRRRSRRPIPTRWNQFDLGYERKDTGGHFEWQGMSPWYFRVEGNQVTIGRHQGRLGGARHQPGQRLRRSGVPGLVHDGHGHGRGRATARGRCSSRRAICTASSTTTTRSFQWTNPFFGNQLDNDVPAARQRLPAHRAQRRPARPAVRLDALRALHLVEDHQRHVGPAVRADQRRRIYVPTLPNTEHVRRRPGQPDVLAVADVDAGQEPRYQDLLQLVRPRQQLDARHVRRRRRRSTATGPVTNELYSYRKNNAGIEGIYRFNRANRLSGGWDYLDIDQTRVDYDDRHLQQVLGRVQEHLARQRHRRASSTGIWSADSNFLLGDAGTGPNDPFYLNRFIARFDNSPPQPEPGQGRRVDWSPAPLLRHVVRVHLQGQRLQGHGARPHRRPPQRDLRARSPSATSTKWRVTLMGDYEWVKYDSYPPQHQRHGRSGRLRSVDAAQQLELQLVGDERGQQLAARCRRSTGSRPTS